MHITAFELRVLAICLIPIGAWLLTKGIRWAKKSVSGAVLLDMPFTQQAAEFTVTREGNYAIWQKGRSIGKVPVAMPRVFVTSHATFKPVHLDSPFGQMSSNSGGMGRTLAYKFSASPGTYTFAFETFPAVTSGRTGLPFKWLQKMFPPAPYFIEIKEKQSSLYLILGVLTILLAAFCIIGGLVFAVNANQIIN